MTEAKPGADPGSSAGSAGRMLEILELVAAQPGGIGVRETARRTGIDRSAVGRMLRRLEELGCVRRSEEGAAYRAADRLYALAATLGGHDSLLEAARPMLQRLVSTYHESSYLAVRHHDAMVFREKVDCTHPIRYVIELHRPFPLATAATGTAIMAGLPDREVREVLARTRLEPYTPDSLLEPSAFLRAVDQARRTRYAVSLGRWVRNGAAIASPFFGASGACRGAVTLNCPADRLAPPDPDEVGRSVRAAAADLSRRLGYLGDWHHSGSLSETAS